MSKTMSKSKRAARYYTQSGNTKKLAIRIEDSVGIRD